jgi:hypothetical protein
MSVIQRVEELPDIDLQYPTALEVHRLPPQLLQGLVCRPPGPEAIRAGMEILLVERFQGHDDRPLQDLVLQRRYPQRPRLLRAVALGDVHPPHRWCPVRAGLGSVQERTQVVHQVRFVVLRRLSVHARSPAPARALVGL